MIEENVDKYGSDRKDEFHNGGDFDLSIFEAPVVNP